MNKLYLAGGCFWCIADYLSNYEGIEEINAGYSGGNETSVSYEEVKSQKTHHRETVEIIFNDKISKEEIIDIYFSYVDPLDKEGQFIDKGHSYTLAMYYQNEEEYQLFKNKINELEKSLNQKVYIAVEPFKFFIKAEEYHQSYSKKNPEAFYKELLDSNRVCHLAKYKK